MVSQVVAGIDELTSVEPVKAFVILRGSANGTDSYPARHAMPGCKNHVSFSANGTAGYEAIPGRAVGTQWMDGIHVPSIACLAR